METTTLKAQEVNGSAAEVAGLAEATDASGTTIGPSPERTEREQPTAEFEITLPGGCVRGFSSQCDVREGILSGQIPRDALIRPLSQKESEAKPVEKWAKSNSKLRSLYTPVWSATLKGALVGFIAVGAARIHPGLALSGTAHPAIVGSPLLVLSGYKAKGARWIISRVGGSTIAGAGLWAMLVGSNAFGGVIGGCP